MSRFLDKLNQASRAVPQPVGFRLSQPVPSKPKMLLIASLAQADIDSLADYVVGADAGLLHIPKLNSAAKILQKISQDMPDIPWGGWLTKSAQEGMKQIAKIGCDFVVFPATGTPLAILQDDKTGKVLEVEPSLSEGSLRAVNELPIGAVLIAGEQGESNFLTWHHLILFQRFANLLTKPLLVSIPSKVTSVEFQALWEVGVDGVVIEVEIGQPDRLKGLRQIVDKITFPSRRKRGKIEPLLPYVSRETDMVEEEEEEE
jgi:hypothetical protein